MEIINCGRKKPNLGKNRRPVAEGLSLQQKLHRMLAVKKNFRDNNLVNLLMLQVRKIGPREATD